MFIAEMFYGTARAKSQSETSYLEEAAPQVVITYPGRFQPFHLGHRDVFESLQAKYGRDSVFIATSNKTELPKSPFNFTDKTVLMHAAGVPSDRIIQVKSPYQLPINFDPANTIFVVAIGAPDADRLRPGSFKKDGQPGYYQKFESLDKCKTADQHGYVIIAAERQKVITLGGQKYDVSHGTPSRAVWNIARNDPKLRAEYLMQMYGSTDPEIGRILDKIPTDATVAEHIVKTDGKYRLVSKKSGRNLGTYDTKAGAEKRERQVQYFKHMGEEAAGVGVVSNSKDPRYVMATMGDQNDVDASTLPKMMKAYGLVGRKLPKDRVKEAEELLSRMQSLQEQLAALKAKK